MSDDVMDVEDCIEELLRDDNYRQLMELKPEFDLFEFIGTLTENASSRALAFLLDSGAEHGLGTGFFEALIESVFQEEKSKELRISLRQRLRLFGETTTTVTEWATSEGRYLDILIKVYDSDRRLTAVVGIENKHWAEEQDKQVAHYQNELVRSFPDANKILLFLAPGTRLSLTADMNCECPYVPCSYRSVIAALKSIESIASDEIQFLTRSLRNHLDKNLEGSHTMSAKIRELVFELYRNPKHKNAIKQIMENIPRFGSLVDNVQAGVESWLRKEFASDPFDFTTYPARNRDRLMEMQLRPTDLQKRTQSTSGFQFIYLLHADRTKKSPDIPELGDFVTVQLMAWIENKKVRANADQFLAELKVPPYTGKLDSWYAQWVPIWAGPSHKLVDLGSADTEACIKLLVDSVDATYPTIKLAVEKAFPEPKEVL